MKLFCSLCLIPVYEAFAILFMLSVISISFTGQWYIWLVIESNWQLEWIFLPQERICVAFFQNSFKTSTMNNLEISNHVKTGPFLHPQGAGFRGETYCGNTSYFTSYLFVILGFDILIPSLCEFMKMKIQYFPTSQYFMGRVVFLLIYIFGFPFLP